jgi:hypothetical protein
MISDVGIQCIVAQNYILMRAPLAKDFFYSFYVEHQAPP